MNVCKKNAYLSFKNILISFKTSQDYFFFKNVTLSSHCFYSIIIKFFALDELSSSHEFSNLNLIVHITPAKIH